MDSHASVAELKKKSEEPINLEDCLKAFTKEEQLGLEESWYCSKCKEHREATKKLDLWTLPPVLIVHLKRFHNVNGRWVKSQRQVKMPLKDFNVFDHLTPPKWVPYTPPPNEKDGKGTKDALQEGSGGGGGGGGAAASGGGGGGGGSAGAGAAVTAPRFEVSVGGVMHAVNKITSSKSLQSSMTAEEAAVYKAKLLEYNDYMSDSDSDSD